MLRNEKAKVIDCVLSRILLTFVLDCANLINATKR